MKFGTHVHDLLTMNCNNLVIPLTFHLLPLSGQSFNITNTLVYNEMLSKLLIGLGGTLS